MNENTVFAAIAALVCLPLALGLAASGLPAVSASLLFSMPKRVKVFRDKFGQQTSTLCLLVGAAAVACLGCAAAVLPSRFPAVASFWLGWPVPAACLSGCVLVAGVLAILYRATWQSLKDKRLLQGSIGVLASLAGWLTGYLFVTFFRHFTVSFAGPGSDPALYLPPLASSAWLLLPAMLFLSLCLAGATASLYLIARRNTDDFGRDYYNYALQLACKWSLFPVLAAMGCLGALFYVLWPVVREAPVRDLFFWGHCGALAALTLACGLWAMVLRSQNPLRLKLHCLSAWMLAVLGLASVGTALARFFLG